VIRAGGLRIAVGERTLLMGILNVTPDSFSDGGEYFDRRRAVAHAVEMARDGADIIDVGGESTRPGAGNVGLDEEIGRTIPVIKAIVKAVGVPVSIDTRSSEVARAAIDAGARIVNDVSGLLHDPKMASLVAERGAGVIIMHMRGEPADMQARSKYSDVVGEVIAELGRSLNIAKRAGIRDESTVIDPGIGFAKDAAQSYEILRRLAELKTLGRPICAGVSRKSFIGTALGGAGPGKRIWGTVAACAAAIMNGADILRVHDVRMVRDAAAVTDRIIR
jgi:dihydropteroate synthase